MDTVTEARLAIAMAREGGIGDHPQEPVRSSAQAHEVDKVKRSESGMIVDPVTLPPGPDRSAEALELMSQLPHLGRADHRRGGRLVGILTNRDLRFEKRLDRPVARA